jgi:hypothetical protein
MAENTYGMPQRIFESFRGVDSNESLKSLLTSWRFRPSAVAAVFIPGQEQVVIDFLQRGLAESGYDQKIVFLNDLMKRYPNTEHLFKSFFSDEIKGCRVNARQKKSLYFPWSRLLE